MTLFMFVLAVHATLELRTVQASASEQYPAITAAESEFLSAQGDALSSRGGFDPAFVARLFADPLGYYKNVQGDVAIEQPTPLWGTTLFGGYRIGRGDYPVYKEGALTNDYGELRVGLNLPVVRNGPTDRRRAGVRRAELGVDAANANKQQTKLEVVRAASLRYYAWVAAGLRRGLAEQMLALAKERDAQIARRVQAGDLPQVERLDNQRIIAQRQAFMVAATRSLQQAAIELSLYYRDSSGEPQLASDAQLPPSLPTLPAREKEALEQLIARALAARPEMKRVAIAAEQNQIERDLQRNQLLPALDLRVAASQDLGPGSTTRAPFELSAGLVLDLPLAFRAQRGRVQVADGNLGRAQAQLRLQRDRIVAEVRDGWSALAAAIERHGAATVEAELAAEIGRLERSRFAFGESTIFMVNLRETASVEAQARVIDATLDAHRAHIELQTVTASLLD